MNDSPRRLRIKVCGLRDERHASVAMRHGADLLGFVFVPGARRRLEVEEARRLVQACRQHRGGDSAAEAAAASAGTGVRPALVGLFGDQPLGEVNETLTRTGLEMAQLCGRESVEYCTRVVRPVINVVHVDAATPPEKEVEHLDALLRALARENVMVALDSSVPGHHGGAGTSFDWGIAAGLAERHDFLLAGGLTPDNVADAVRRVRPWGVDVSSGVETGGIKDAGKIEAFITAARAAGTVLHSERYG